MTTPSTYNPANPESVFTYGALPLKTGSVAAEEIGHEPIAGRGAEGHGASPRHGEALPPAATGAGE